MFMRGEEQFEEIIDGAIMDWDLKEFGWEPTDFDPKYDEHLELDADDDGDLVLDFTSSMRHKINAAPPDQSPEVLRFTSSTANMVDQLAEAAGSMDKPSNNKDAARGSVLVSPKRLSGTQKMSCLVDDCKADLSSCRDYHRRHRVCEQHSKTPTVIVKGEEKRFCQQCSRFHSLGEFDEVKRSCRKRLDGHNRRRRKSQPEPFYWSSKGFLSSHKGPRILHFGNPQICATATVRGMWPMETKTGSESWIYTPHKRFQVINYHQNHPPTPSYGGDKSRFLLQKHDTDTRLGGNQTNPEKFLCHPLSPPGKGREKRDNHKPVITSSDEEISLPIDSGGRALYLLSTHPTQLISSSYNNNNNNNNNNHLVQPEESCSFQLLDNIHNAKDKPADPPLPIYDPATSRQTNMLLRLGPDGLLEHGALQMLPISLE